MSVGANVLDSHLPRDPHLLSPYLSTPLMCFTAATTAAQIDSGVGGACYLPRRSPLTNNHRVVSRPLWLAMDMARQPAAAGLLPWGRLQEIIIIDRLLHGRRSAAAGSATLSAYVRS